MTRADLAWRPAQSGETPGTVEPDDAPAHDVDARGLISYTAIRYRCLHCRKSYAAKGTAERHLERCWRNPKRRTCLTCKHREYGDYGEPDCAIDEGAWPCCNECGQSRRDESGNSYCGHNLAGEARYLQVLCPAWEDAP